MALRSNDRCRPMIPRTIEILMRVFIASDDSGLSYQLREQLLVLGHECPTSHVVALDRAVPLLLSLTEGAGASSSGEAPGDRTAAKSDLVFVILAPLIDRSLDLVG